MQPHFISKLPCEWKVLCWILLRVKDAQMLCFWLHLVLICDLPFSLWPLFLKAWPYEFRNCGRLGRKHEKRVVCFALFICTTKSGEKCSMYRRHSATVHSDQVDVHWEAICQVKSQSSVDVHASESAT